MRKYDLSVLVDVANGEEAAKEINKKVEETIIKANGSIIKNEFQGRLDLAGTFKKHTQAYSMRIHYEGDNGTIEALNKEFKINEQIIRSLNLTLESVFSPSQIVELTK